MVIACLIDCRLASRLLLDAYRDIRVRRSEVANGMAELTTRAVHSDQIDRTVCLTRWGLYVYYAVW